MLSLLTIASILFLATFTRSAIGFGDALIAMPFLILLVGLKTATPLVALMGSTISLVLLINEWRTLDLRRLWQLILSTFLGIPFGLVLLRFASEDLAKSLLGILLILYGLYQLLGLSLPQTRHPALAVIFGFIAGAFGSAYNTSGAIIVIYGTLQRWEPDYFRINLQGYFLLTNWVIVASHGLAGLWTPQVLQLYAYSLPAIFVGAWAGEIISKKIPKAIFSQLVYVLLILLGILFIT
ncbi:sulfite exporter TauE/SafE family protein [Leptolyngbya sp. FACHB-671]|uniref:sulfite exporter TauE/SafE family protein n=1 Tax=Leptolyngbya sp. FACHB-671 TaxID=2692812 RepID=UPI001689845D|nr:sulfite exporter TauE/SafE family protein [Leptolyngbya sp. FACHB-671]MBD2066862.1 sulfite exporter TauE/SafE family protein [Leptolyngbya sp. FACHB-671]